MKNLFTAVISEIKLFLTNEVKAAGFASQQQHQFISENLLGIPFINNSSFRSAGFAQPELFNQLCLRKQEDQELPLCQVFFLGFQYHGDMGINHQTLDEIMSFISLQRCGCFSYFCLFFFVIITAVTKRS